MHARGVAQLAARHVRDVEVGSSSLLTPTIVACKSLQATIFCYRGVLPMAADYNSEKRLAAKPGRLRRCVYMDNML